MGEPENFGAMPEGTRGLKTSPPPNYVLNISIHRARGGKKDGPILPLYTLVLGL
jgi:hypothetical protein